MIFTICTISLVYFTCLASAAPMQAATDTGHHGHQHQHPNSGVLIQIQHRRHHKRQAYHQQPADVVETGKNMAPENLQWVNPCGMPLKKGGGPATQTYMYALGLLYDAVNLNVNEMRNMQAIRTDEIAEWFALNNTYKFLHRNNQSDVVSSNHHSSLAD